MDRFIKNKNISFFVFTTMLVLSITAISLFTQYNAFGASVSKQTTILNKKVSTTAVNVTTIKSKSSYTTESLKNILQQKGIPSSASINIIVSKRANTLSLYNNGTFLKSYHVELGDGGPDDKVIRGDHKTPEGTFYVSEKSILSPADYYLGTRWMELSYPNTEDADRGLKDGIINKQTHDKIVNAIKSGITPPMETKLGGGIGIHGGSIPVFGKNWTWGCVGLSNKDVEDFYNYIKVGTKVTIE